MGMSIHSLHQFIILVIRYLVIIAVIGFMPVPLLTFLGGDSLSQMQYSPLFEYFSHYQISTDSILQSAYTNVYISETKSEIKPWDIDNAILWADALTYQLSEEHIPVMRKVISGGKPTKVQSLQAIQLNSKRENEFVPEQYQGLFLNLHEKFLNLIPGYQLTEGERQWVILALNSNQKIIKKELKKLIAQNPNDNFLVITQLPTNLGKQTLKINLPHFNIKEAKKIISQALQVSESQAEILLIENQRSLWNLNDDNKENYQFTLKSLLGQNYHPLTDISTKQQAILEQLCKLGKKKTDKKQIDLSDYGVLVKSKNYQWKNDQARFNYMLHKETLCGSATWIDVEEQPKVENSHSNKEEQTQKIQQEAKEIQQQEIKEEISAESKNEQTEQIISRQENELQIENAQL